MKSSRVLRARRLRDHALAPAAASAAFLTSLGRYEACPSIPPTAGRAEAVPVTAVSQRCWDAQGLGRKQSPSATVHLIGYSRRIKRRARQEQSCRAQENFR